MVFKRFAPATWGVVSKSIFEPDFELNDLPHKNPDTVVEWAEVFG